MKARKLKQPPIRETAAANETNCHQSEREAKANAYLLATRVQFARALTIAESLEDRAHGVLAGRLQRSSSRKLEDERAGGGYANPLKESD